MRTLSGEELEEALRETIGRVGLLVRHVASIEGELQMVKRQLQEIVGDEPELVPMKRSDWPATLERLRAAGYKPDAALSTCTCGERALWVETPSNAKMMLERANKDKPQEHGLWQSHFTSCRDADKHRKR